jgi:hypothetical protein
VSRQDTPPGPTSPSRAGRAAAALLCVTALCAGLLLTASCDDGGTPGLKPGKLDPATSPVTFTQPMAQPMASGVLGQGLFAFQVDNTSHCDISAVKFAAVLFDESGKRIAGDPQEVGLTGEVGDIHPGESYECKFTTGDDKAARAAVVLKEVLYVFVPEGESNSLFKVPMKWTNKSFDAQLAAAAPR